MGMAASQARFLQLTARKTNLEYMGQQINQERLSLANQSAGLFERQLTLEPPTPPSSLDDKYFTPAYTFTDPQDGLQKNIEITINASNRITGIDIRHSKFQPDGTFVEDVDTTSYSLVHLSTGWSGIEPISTTPVSAGTVPADTWVMDSSLDHATNYIDHSTGRIKVLTVGLSTGLDTIPDENVYALHLTYSPRFDESAFNDDMNKYEYKKATYDYEIERINMETAQIQEQDRSLELKMKQIDTEHKAISTEIDAVQKVIQKNVESSFKTFS